MAWHRHMCAWTRPVSESSKATKKTWLSSRKWCGAAAARPLAHSAAVAQKENLSQSPSSTPTPVGVWGWRLQIWSSMDSSDSSSKVMCSVHEVVLRELKLAKEMYRGGKAVVRYCPSDRMQKQTLRKGRSSLARVGQCWLAAGGARVACKPRCFHRPCALPQVCCCTSPAGGRWWKEPGLHGHYSSSCNRLPAVVRDERPFRRSTIAQALTRGTARSLVTPIQFLGKPKLPKKLLVYAAHFLSCCPSCTCYTSQSVAPSSSPKSRRSGACKLAQVFFPEPVQPA